jgi:hypothetical protein
MIIRHRDGSDRRFALPDDGGSPSRGITGTIMVIAAAADAAGGSLTTGSYGLSLSR